MFVKDTNMKNKPKQQKCLRCGRPARTRGLCGSDFLTARKLILQGKITERELVKAGKMAPSRHGIIAEWLLGESV